jgi:hypothetical protein
VRALRLVSGALLASTACSDQPQFGDATSTSASTATTTTSAIASTAASASTASGETSSSTGAGAGGADGGGGPGPGGGASEGGAGVGGSGGADPCAALHVAPDGDDAATGCEDAPLATITAALVRAAEDAFDTVLVCSGTFEEELVLGETPLTLRGGHDCLTWEEGADSATRVTAPPMATTTVAMVADGSVTLEDVEIAGPVIPLDADIVPTSIGLRVDGGEHVLRDVAVYGGTSTPSAGYGSIGVSLLGTTSLLERVIVTGGAGTSPDTVGSIGIHVEGGAPRLHQCTVSGGAGVGAVGSLGIVVSLADLTGDAAILGVGVDGGAGRNDDDGSLATAGVAVLNGGVVQIEDSFLSGGEGALANEPPGDCTSDRTRLEAYALYVDPGTAATVVRSRLFGGTSDGAGAEAHITGAARVNDGFLRVEDSLLVTGSSTPTGSCYFTPRGIWMIGSAEVEVSRSTIVARAQGDTTAIWNDAVTGRLAVDGSLLVSLPEGDGVGRTVNWNWADCQATPPDLTSFTDNALVPRTILARMCDQDRQDMPALLEIMPARTPRGGTFEVRSSCSSQDCVLVGLCVDTVACLNALFEDEWDSDGGYEALFLGGLQPNPLIPCEIAEGASVDAACDGDDALGTARTSPCSIGGREIDDACAD